MRRALLVHAIFALALAACGAESTPDELREIGREIQRLLASRPLKHRTAVMVLSPRLMGAVGETMERRIVIIDHGLVQNLRTLRHEWNHLFRLDGGDPNWRDDGPAEKAETEWAEQVLEERQ